MRRLRADQARRIALEAQGFSEPRATGRVDVRHFRKVVDRVGLIQLDSVNVFSRAHYMPFFSRLGPYDRDALDRYLWSSGEMFEYWAHEASLIPTEHHRRWRWMMDRELRWDRMKELEEKAPGYLDEVYRQVADFGPLQTSDLSEPGERGEGMWNWSDGKVALEVLFFNGSVSIAARPNFTRLYDLTERVIDPEHLGPPHHDEDEAMRLLIVSAARHMGVATANDLIDYPRLSRRRGGVQMARAMIPELVASGSLEEVDVEGWDKPGYLHPDAVMPREARGTALLSPFDSLVWFRERTERLWDFHYRIEIYVPEPKRIYGYYVLPFLLDGDLVARVDLKTDRQKGRLQAKGSFAEPGVDPVRVGRELMVELEMVATWLGVDEVEVFPKGDLAGHVR